MPSKEKFTVLGNCIELFLYQPELDNITHHLIHLSIEFETFLKHGGRLQIVVIGILQVI